MIMRGMKLLILPVGFLVSTLFPSGSLPDNRSSAGVPRTSRPIPGFPASPAYLESINASPANGAMRAHAWKLLKYLVPHESDPLWRQKPWQNKCELQLSPRCNDAALNIANPIFPGISPQTPPSEDGNRPVFSTVFYNNDAASFILAKNLNTGEGLQSLIAHGNLDPVSHVIDAPSFPKASIIVKEVWEGFNLNADGGIGSFKSPVAHVYIPGEVKVTGGQLQGVSGWPAFPILLDKAGKIDTASPCNDNAEYDEGRPVPINCFYHVHPPGNCPMSAHAPPAVGAPPLTNYPCYGILVGFQIATGEIGNWTWATFWWSNNPLSDPDHHRGQPSNLNKQFTHYLMDTTFGPVGSATDDRRIVFNPYLEGPNPHGAESNCFHCHNTAAYIPSCTIGQPGNTCSNQNSAKAVSGVPGRIPACAVAAKGQQRVDEHCALKTARLWSLATNQDNDTHFPALF
jgi:hypothetical protein